MPPMGEFRRLQGFGWFAPLLLLTVTVGCSRPGGFRAAESGSQDPGQDLPFHQDAGSPADRTKSDSDVPFNGLSASTLPSGTLLTVRLETALSGSRQDAGREFTAVVDAPVTVDGTRVLPRGTSVRGRVECSHPSETQPGTGYVCLTLDSMVVGGKAIPLQTSSLFARGGEPDAAGGPSLPRSTLVYLKKGHRLTFRLTRNVVLAASGVGDSPENASRGSK